MDKYSLEEEIKRGAERARKLARYMCSTEDLVEEQIRKARERGDFDNLEGAGKPLNLEENPFESSDMRMILKILKNSDFTPFWIDLGKDIDAKMDKIWRDAKIFKKYSKKFNEDKNSKAKIKRYNKRKELFYYECQLQLEDINQKIIDYNLHCPTFRLGRGNLELDQEMLKIINFIEND